MRVAAFHAPLLALLVGCASMQEPEWVWTKPGSTQAEFEMDHGQCTAQAFGPGGVSLMQAAIIQTSCLRGKGWRQTQR